MTFEWDNSKAASNLLKHGVMFEESVSAFNDPFSLVIYDDKHSEHEVREWLIGENIAGKVLVVVYTKREAIRIISARPAHRKERKLYEKNKNRR